MFVNERFVLDEAIVNNLYSRTPRFGYNGFGEFIFYRTYSRVKKDGGQESWGDVVRRVTEGIFSIRKDFYVKNSIHWDESLWQHYAMGFAINLFEMKFLAPGRGLWACGTDFVYERGSMPLNNCFSGDTKYVTDDGVYTLKESVGRTVQVLTDTGEVVAATVKSYGRQALKKYTFKPKLPGSSKFKFTVEATENHRWLLTHGQTTMALKCGDVIKSCAVYPMQPNSIFYEEGFIHGLVFADGNQHKKYNDRYQIRLCGDKNKYIKLFSDHPCLVSITQPETYSGDYLITLAKVEVNYKDFPDTDTTSEYRLGFLEGWMAFDGYTSSRRQNRVFLDSTDERALSWLMGNNCYLGYSLVAHNIDNRPTNYGPRSKPLHRFNLSKEPTFYYVESVTDVGVEDVYCLEVPSTHTFTLACGLPTSNCAYLAVDDNIGHCIDWIMDCLMMGVGVGFSPVRNDNLKTYTPKGVFDYIIPDSREGWTHATKILINSYLRPGMNAVRLIYDKIRPSGLPIKGFGGISSGPEPLIIFHEQIREFFNMYSKCDWYDSVMLKTDIVNACGCAVVAGSVRRSAELCMGPYDDIMDLKDLQKYPHREPFLWMSNNSVALETDRDFERLGEIASRVVRNAEPGYCNLRNLQYGRIGKSMDGLRKDMANGLNPCGEMQLEGVGELCCLAETCPTRCDSVQEWLKAVEYATFYASTVTLLPTHRPETNAVMLRNRRIGVGIIDYVGWEKSLGTTKIITALRTGYDRVRSTNNWLNDEAGVPRAIRTTTFKPGGTAPKLPGLRSGWQWPTFGKTLRRVRVAQNSPIFQILHEANIPHEPDRVSANTEVFEWPIDQSDGGMIQPATEISLWRQAMTLVLLQREWSDNAVSNTLYFKPRWSLTKKIELGDSFYSYDLSTTALDQIYDYLTIGWDTFLETQEWEGYNIRLRLEQDRWSDKWFVMVYTYNPNHEEDDIESVLAAIAPLTKSVSLLPHSANGVYIQSPEEGISDEEYARRLAEIRPIDWSKLSGSDGEDEKFCSGPQCDLPGNQLVTALVK